MAQKVKEKKNTVDLTAQKDSIAFILSEYHAQFDNICLDETISMDEKKAMLIEFMITYTRATPCQQKTIDNIKNFRGDCIDLLQYMYNIILAGAGMPTII